MRRSEDIKNRGFKRKTESFGVSMVKNITV